MIRIFFSIPFWRFGWKSHALKNWSNQFEVRYKNPSTPPILWRKTTIYIVRVHGTERGTFTYLVFHFAEKSTVFKTFCANLVTKKWKKLQNLYFLKNYIFMFPCAIFMSFELYEILISILKAMNMAFLEV